MFQIMSDINFTNLIVELSEITKNNGNLGILFRMQKIKKDHDLIKDIYEFTSYVTLKYNTIT